MLKHLIIPFGNYMTLGMQKELYLLLCAYKTVCYLDEIQNSIINHYICESFSCFITEPVILCNGIVLKHAHQTRDKIDSY